MQGHPCIKIGSSPQCTGTIPGRINHIVSVRSLPNRSGLILHIAKTQVQKKKEVKLLSCPKFTHEKKSLHPGTCSGQRARCILPQIKTYGEILAYFPKDEKRKVFLGSPGIYPDAKNGKLDPI